MSDKKKMTPEEQAIFDKIVNDGVEEEAERLADEIWAEYLKEHPEYDDDDAWKED